MIGKSSIWKKILITTIGSGSSQIINFIFGVILVRLLTIEEYAVYKQGNLILTMCMSFFFIISPISLGYFMGKAKDKQDKKIYLYQTIFSLLLVSFVGSYSIYYFRDIISNLYSNPLLKNYLGYFTIIIFLETGCSYYTYYMVADNKNKKLAFVTFFFSLLRVIALLISIVNKNNLFLSFMKLYLISVLLKFIFMIYDTYKDYKNISFRIDLSKFKNQFFFSIPIMIMGIITTLNNNLDKNLVSLFYEPSQYSIYVNGAFDIPFVNIISTSVITVMLPEISSKFSVNNHRLLDIIYSYKEIISISISIIIPLFFSILLFSKEVVIILFSEKYISCMQLFDIYLLMLFFKGINISVLLTAANKQLLLIKNGIIMIISNAVLLIIINKLLGFNYLTLSPVIATLLMYILITVDIKKVYRFKKYSAFIPFKSIIYNFLISIILFFTFDVFKNMFQFSSALVVIVGPIVYAIMLLGCIGTNPDFRMFLKKGFFSK